MIEQRSRLRGKPSYIRIEYMGRDNGDVSGPFGPLARGLVPVGNAMRSYPMIKRRPKVTLCLLCALLFSVAAAQAANAAGTTAYTCVEGAVAPNQFTDSHCRVAGEGKYKHIAIANKTTTEITVTNVGVGRLKATIGGIATEFIATGTQASGWMENTEAGGEMYIHGLGTTTYTGVSVNAPANKGCKVSTDNGGVAGEVGVIHTNTLKGTSQGQGDMGKLEPAEGEVFATFIMSGCTGSAALEALNKTYTVTGSVKCAGTGSTVQCTHASTTEQNTLKLNGSIKAGVEVETTAVGRDKPTEAYTPLAVTT